jgi:regulator of protease activity HflC (stomatin/prohibitin superfamily)
MDVWFILFLIVGAAALIATGVGYAAHRGDEFEHPFVAAAIAWGLTLVAFFLSTFVIVPTKTVGIETSFGKPGAVYGNGWHWKSPTSQVHKFDASLQSDHYSTDKDDDGDAIPVRLFTGSQATLNITFQWRLEDGANFVQVYNNYRDPDRIKTNLVKRALQQALNDQFENFNPYAALIAAQSAGATPGTTQVAQSFDSMGKDALARLTAEFAPQGVQAVSLTIASINYDAKTQANLDGLSSAIASTQIATQNKATAQQQADANALLNGKPATPETLTQLCIQASEKVLEEGHALPAGWSCFGPNTAAITAGK